MVGSGRPRSFSTMTRVLYVNQPKVRQWSQPCEKAHLRGNTVRLNARPPTNQSLLPEAGAPHRQEVGKALAITRLIKSLTLPRRRSLLEQSPETALSNKLNDLQPPSQVFENGNTQSRMGSIEENYVVASNSSRAVFPGPPIPRSEIPRTINDGLDRSTLLLLLQDTPKESRDSRIAGMISESERYQNMVYAPQGTRLESTVSRTGYFQPSQSSTSTKSQNAPAVEHRQITPRADNPAKNDKDKEEEEQLSSSGDEDRRGCRQH
jgi:hypothetical protein